MNPSKLKGIHIDWIPFIISDLSKESDSLVFVVENNKKALYLKAIFEKICKDSDIIYLEEFDSEIYEPVFCDLSTFTKRAIALNKLATETGKKILITSLKGINYLTVPKDFFLENFELKSKNNFSMNSMISKLIDFGYNRVEVVGETGQFAVRGGIVDVFNVTSSNPIRIDFLGNTIESIREFNIDSQISLKNLDSIVIEKCSEIILNEDTIKIFKKKFRFEDSRAKEAIITGRFFHGIEWYLNCFHEKLIPLLEYFSKDTKFIFDFEIEKLNNIFFEEINKRYNPTLDNVLPKQEIFTNVIEEIVNKFEVYKVNPFEQNEIFHLHEKVYNIKTENSLNELIENINNETIFSVSSNGAFHILNDILSTIKTSKKIDIIISPLQEGFISNRLSVYTEKELFGGPLKCAPRKHSSDIFKDYTKLSVGDYVVHEKHGIAIFEGMTNISVSEIAHDFLSLVYKNNDKLYVPVENIALISRYGGEDINVELDTLKGTSWTKRKGNVRKKLLVIANNLLQIAAKRKTQKIQEMIISNEEYDKFCKRFQFIETDDQLLAIDDIVTDLQGSIPMDRLVCGDVGFGKTEVALRAAFIVASNLKQVVLLAPTTVLVSQHYKNFLKRFDGFGINICQLSRFISAKEMKENIKKIENGEINIIIATHAILSNKIKFFDLGLVIIDEEQHFGVKQKEFMKSLRGDIHFMTLSATPIPRTLQLAISGVKELSIIATPPIARLPVKTFVSELEEHTIKNAIESELKRGGQVFFVSPRVEYLNYIYGIILKLFPDIKAEVVHGKTPNLEEIIRDFCDGKIDVLISTNIIDSGVDIPNANTIIIHRIDLFGLSQIYQLRGRVGRSQVQAYAYFMLPENKALTKEATKRLEVMQSLNKLGSGFTLASHDLDIRGAGNMLGEEQSGYIRDVGVELYQSMLQEAILMLKTGTTNSNEIFNPQINLGVAVLIPETYIEDVNLRLSMYRKIGNIKTESELDFIAFELSDRFGQIPIEVFNLLTVIKLMIYCKKANIEKVDVGNSGFSISLFENKCKNPPELINLLNSDIIKNNNGAAKVTKDLKIVITKKWKSIKERTDDVVKIIKKISEIMLTERIK